MGRILLLIPIMEGANLKKGMRIIVRPIAIATIDGGGEVPLPKIEHNHHQQSNNHNLLPYHNHFQTHYYDGPYPLEQDNVVLVVAIITVILIIIIVIIVVPVEVVVAIPVNAEEEEV